MSAEKRNWYRTGAVAKMLETSSHRIRELARVGLIESQMRNGYRYIPAAEVERLQEGGLPPMPASADLDGPSAEDGDQQADGASRPARSRLVQDLYAEPSRQLAKSKEKLIRLEHAARASEIKEQMRQRRTEERERQERVHRADQEERWRQTYISWLAQKLPAEAIPGARAKLDALLDSVPPCTNVAAQVDEIIRAELRPYHQREDQARALQAHTERIMAAVKSKSLPYGATPDEREESRELALQVLRALPVAASDRQIRLTAEEAIRPIVDRINGRRADEDRRLQEDRHRRQIEVLVSWCAPWDATEAEARDAKQRVRAALEQLPATATDAEMEAAKKEAFAPVLASIKRRKEAEHAKEQASLRLWLGVLSSHVEVRLRELEDAGDLEFDDSWDRSQLRDRVADKIRPMILDALVENPGMSDGQLKRKIGHLVDEHYQEFRE